MRVLLAAVFGFTLMAGLPAVRGGEGAPPQDEFDQAIRFLGECQGRSAITVADALEVRARQVRLQQAIEALPPDARRKWVDAFNGLVADGDTLVAGKPLAVPLAGGQAARVPNTTDLALRLVARYRLMDQSGTIDLTRLAGVAAADVAGLDSLEAHLAARTIGPAYDLPMFDLYSPLGNLQLLDRLVRKFARERGLLVPSPNGPPEVVTDVFLRCLDGTKPAFDQAVAAAAEVFATQALELPHSPLTVAAIKDALGQFEALNRRLVEAVSPVLTEYHGEAVFRNALIDELAAAINQGTGSGLGYGQLWNAWWTGLSQADALYDLNGQILRVGAADLDRFANGLPGDLATLYRYPGVLADIDPGFVPDLISAEYFDRLQRVDLLQEWPPAFAVHLDAPAALTEPPVWFSYPARRFQLLPILLAAWADEVVGADAGVDFDRLRAKLLLSPALEAELLNAEALIGERAAAMLAYGALAALSEADYAAMTALLAATRAELAASFSPLLEGVIYNAWYEVTARVDVRYQELTAAFDSGLGKALVRVELANGEELLADPRDLRAQVIDRALAATAIRIAWSNGFLRAAYLRLSGIDDGLLAGLLPPASLQQLRHFDFGTCDNAPPPAESFAGEEILFRLVPRLVGRFGTASVLELTAHLTLGVPLPVALGNDLEREIRRSVEGHVRATLAEIPSSQPQNVADLESWRDRFVGCHASLTQAVRALGEQLAAPEKAVLENWINWDWQSDANLAALRRRCDAVLAGINILDVATVETPVARILAIPQFPWSTDYDHELFPGLLPADFAEVETADMAEEYRVFAFGERAFYATSHLSALGRIQVVDHLIRRLRDGQIPPGAEEGLAAVFLDADGRMVVDVEAFRQYLKGVPAMLRRVQEQAAARVSAAAAMLEAERRPQYTAAEITALYRGIVLKTRADLIALLEQEAGKHERQDVLRAENPVGQIFQQQVFSLFVQIVGAAQLVVEVNGTTVVVPARAMVDTLIESLRSEVGSAVAAHDFARFYGLSLADVRELHKFESYLGEQVVALPRNSEPVPIVSQISELGYLQLAALLVERYAADIVTESGEVQVGRLIALLTDREHATTAFAAAAARATARREMELNAFDGPLSLKALDGITEALEGAKLDLVGLGNDFLSGLVADDLPALRARVEAIINAQYDRLRQRRDAIVAANRFAYEVEVGGELRTVAFHFDAWTLDRFIAFVEAYAAAHPAPALSSGSDGAAAYALLGWEKGLAVDGLVATDGMLSWFRCPIPSPQYDPAHHPTRFGMAVLLARLAVDLAEFATVETEDGSLTLDMDRFEQELLLADRERAERRLAALLAEGLPAATEFINLRRAADGALPVEALEPINRHFLAVKARVQDYADVAYDRASAVWAEFAKVYEDNLFAGRLSCVGGGGSGNRVTFSAQSLDEALMSLARAGAIAPEILRPFADLIQAGETTWEYDAFKYLRWFHPYMDMDGGWGESATAAADPGAAGGTATSAAGTFTMADLDNLPAVDPADLASLDVAERDALRVTLMDLQKLLGLLDLRALTPGSGVSAGGLMNADFAGGKVAALVGEAAIPEVATHAVLDALTYKSLRFRAFALLPALIAVAGPDVIGDDGAVERDKFALFLQGRDPLADPAALTLIVTVDGEVVSDAAAWVRLEAAAGRALRLTAEAPAGCVFARWSGDVSGLATPGEPSSLLQAQGATTLTVSFVTLGECTILLHPGWNLISTSVLPEQAAVADVFPADSILPPVWRIEGRGYVETTSLEPRKAYWVLCPPDGSTREIPLPVLVKGRRSLTASVALARGWNFAGPLQRLAPPRLAGQDATVWNWNPQKQAFAPLPHDGTLEPGVGYCIFTDQPCEIPLR